MIDSAQPASRGRIKFDILALPRRIHFHVSRRTTSEIYGIAKTAIVVLAGVLPTLVAVVIVLQAMLHRAAAVYTLIETRAASLEFEGQPYSPKPPPEWPSAVDRAYLGSWPDAHFKAAVQNIGSDGGDLPFAQIRRQSAPSRARFKRSLPHQSFDPMKSARYSFGEQIVPHPPSATGSIACQEAGTNLCTNFLITAAAITARPCQPGIEPTSRDTERLAQPFRRPDPRCFATKPNFTSIPSRSRRWLV